MPDFSGYDKVLYQRGFGSPSPFDFILENVYWDSREYQVACNKLRQELMDTHAEGGDYEVVESVFSELDSAVWAVVHSGGSQKGLSQTVLDFFEDKQQTTSALNNDLYKLIKDVTIQVRQLLHE